LTAEPVLDAVNDTADSGVSGSMVSPSSKRTAAIGRPRLSAAIWVMIV